MLTIRGPISLKTTQPIHTIREDLAMKIQANYGLMQAPLRKEELLHITAEPPEVYFAEGDMVQIFTDVTNQTKQEVRLDVINTLINRILVAQTENFSYQDTVYISSILRKLGIRDEKNFMRQVFALQNETTERHQLLRQYEENQEILQMLFTQEAARAEAAPAPQEKTETAERRYYLHDAIFKRLDTGTLYQDMRRYSKGLRHESQQIFRTEFHMGEQAAVAQAFHLHQLQQRATGQDVPLYYYHANEYEYLQELSEHLFQSVEEQITAALLLNLTDRSFALRQEQIAQNSHHWYSVAGALFQTAENTWKRYESNLTEGKRLSQQNVQMLTEVNAARRVEGDTIQTIAAEYKSLHQEWQTAQQLRQSILQQRNIWEGDRQEIFVSGGTYRLTQEELELHFLQQEDAEEAEKTPQEITVEQLQRQLEQFNQKNYENYQKLTEIQMQQPRLKERRPDRKKAQQDALRALENPGEVLREYFTAEIADPVAENRREAESRLYELFSDETKEIYRQYLSQHRTAENTFLQHIMAQPEADETKQEVVQIMERLQREEIQRQTERVERLQTEILRPVVTQEITEELRQQMLSLQQQQQATVYEQWVRPVELHWQREVETETETQPAAQAAQESAAIQAERTRTARAREETIRTVQETERQELIHTLRETAREEEFLTERETETILQAERQLTEIKQTIEQKLQLHQQEQATALTEAQRELTFRQVELVHKAEEQTLDEALLETIRSNREQTRREEHTTQTTVQQSSVNERTVQESINRLHTNRSENIEELIQQNVKKQLGNLSEQVYGKIEKKLQAERKRRGFS